MFCVIFFDVTARESSPARETPVKTDSHARSYKIWQRGANRCVLFFRRRGARDPTHALFVYAPKKAFQQNARNKLFEEALVYFAGKQQFFRRWRVVFDNTSPLPMHLEMCNKENIAENTKNLLKALRKM